MKKNKKLEIHYFLNNQKHSMDALIRNKCEAELLALAYEIIDELGFDVHLNSEAYKEGGLKEFWDLLGKNSNQVHLIIALFMLIITIAGNSDGELNELQEEYTRLQIDKLKEEDKKTAAISETTIYNAAKELSQIPKIAVRRSNFYKRLQKCIEVSQFGITPLTENYESTQSETLITRNEFLNFMLRSNELPDVKIENADIIIIAPILDDSKAKWKGVYDNENINFIMQDKAFKELVTTKQISFRNGDVISCNLTISRELSETGETVTKNYTVNKVLDKEHNKQAISLADVKKRQYKKDSTSKQNSFDF